MGRSYPASYSAIHKRNAQFSELRERGRAKYRDKKPLFHATAHKIHHRNGCKRINKQIPNNWMDDLLRFFFWWRRSRCHVPNRKHLGFARKKAQRIVCARARALIDGMAAKEEWIKRIWRWLTRDEWQQWCGMEEKCSSHNLSSWTHTQFEAINCNYCTLFSIFYLSKLNYTDSDHIR